MKNFVKLAKEKLAKGGKLLRIGWIINWEQLSWILKKVDRPGISPSGYDTQKLQNALILQALHSLSDVVV
jgi:hypothetical protein